MTVAVISLVKEAMTHGLRVLGEQHLVRVLIDQRRADFRLSGSLVRCRPYN